MADPDWHTIEADDALTRLGTSTHGLTTAEAQRRLTVHGSNAIPETQRRTSLFDHAHLS